MPKPKRKPTGKETTVSDVVAAIEPLAPPHLAEDWDQVGLQVGRWDDPVSAGLLCIDFTPAVLDEALEKQCDFVVAYHPPMFKPLGRLVGGMSSEPGGFPTVFEPWKQTLMVEAIRHKVAVFSPHTALDAVRGGMNDWLCDGLGDSDARYAGFRGRSSTGYQKVVVYVPRGETVDRVRQAMVDAGAGSIGAYDHCSFNIDGVGTFRGGEDTSPAIGEPGKVERVEETRIEMACFAGNTAKVLDAIRNTHPYEEPAIDVFDVAGVQPQFDQASGPGRWFHLDDPVTPEVLANRVKKRLDRPDVRLARPAKFVSRNGVPDKLSGVAVCVGAGGSLFNDQPSFAHQPDAYITGEMQHHQVLDLVQRGKVVILAGHTNTERPFLPRYREMIEETDAGRVQWHVSEADATPWVLV